MIRNIIYMLAKSIHKVDASLLATQFVAKKRFKMSLLFLAIFFVAPAISYAQDFDGDGIFDGVDIDGDGDGILDINEAGFNFNTDSDGDGISDNREAQSTAGFQVPLGADTDGDGLDNRYDATPAGGPGGSSGITPVNTDGTGPPDCRDIDSDGDGILDSIEGLVDQGAPDVDTEWNFRDTDSDQDGISDNVEAQTTVGFQTPLGIDADGDGLDDRYDANLIGAAGSNGITPVNTDGADTNDYVDLDSDNDTIPDATETASDSLLDADTIPNYRDLDSDSDGIIDGTDGVGDSALDVDLFVNYLDTDSDGDGILDNLEAQTTAGFIASTGVDTDGDGLDNAYDLAVGFAGSSGLTPVNTDGADTADYIDLDSDNDTINDSVEGTTDSDGDGERNFRDLDSDNDGINDAVEGSADSALDTDAIPNYLDLDSDGDGIIDGIDGATDSVADADVLVNYLDTDSDGDGISDNIEAQATVGFLAPSGSDTDNDGLDNAYDSTLGYASSNGIIPVNTDGADTNDYVDLDSDNDGVTDAIETASESALDIDTIPNFRDLDSDGDGIPDNVEAQATNAYIVPNYLDADGDGLMNSYEPNGITPVNSDGDAFVDMLDNNSDADGAVDSIESGLTLTGTTQANGLDSGAGIAGFTDVNGNAHNGTIFILTNTNPILLANGSNAIPYGVDFDYRLVVDTDKDGLADTLDLDDDNDGILDTTESFNYAILGTATQSSTLAVGFEASYGVDGNTASAPNYIHTSGATATDWWEVNLNTINVPITNIKIWNRDDCCQDRLGNVYVMIADTPFPANPNDLAGSLANADYTYRLPTVITGDVNVPVPNVSGQYVRLQKSGTNPGSPAINIAEVQVFASRDTDLDGKPNISDIDSDNDGIPDIVEAQATGSYITPNANSNANYQTNFGVNTAYIGLPGGGLTPVNTDGTDVADYLDLDSDNDSVLDINESRNPNIALVLADADNDGLQDGFDSVANNIFNINTNSIDFVTNFNLLTDIVNPGGQRDFRQSIDSDNDGIVDTTDIDDDNDGILDSNELLSFIQNLTVLNHASSTVGGTASQSTTLAGFTASLANDNNTTNFAHTLNTTPHEWWQVDLGANSLITQVNIFNRVDCCQDRLGNVFVMVADTPFPADSNDLAGSLANADFVYQLPTLVTGNITVQVPNVFGRYVRLQNSGTNIKGGSINIAEVEVLGSYPNLSLGGTATQISTLNSAVAKNAIDGNTAGVSDLTTAHTLGLTSTDWWQVDLGVNSPISLITVYNRDDSNQERLGNVYLMVADTPFPADLAGSLSNSDYTYQFPAVTSGDYFLKIPNIIGQYVRLQKSGVNPGGPNINIAEVEVFGDGSVFDFDNDGYPNRVDIDSDNDGIPDNVEAQNTLQYFQSDFLDTDGDGLLQRYDQNNSGVANSLGLKPLNKDGTDYPDFIDTDADNDGILDMNETFENGPLTNNDSDRDGLDDAFDDVNTLGLPFDTNDNIDDPRVDLPDIDQDLFTGEDLDYRDAITTPLIDNDLDGLSDAIDVDDDNDGILDISECVLSSSTGQLQNGSFEVLSGPLGSPYQDTPATSVFPWKTTDSQNRIEIYPNAGFITDHNPLGVQSGNYAVEINAYENAAIYQDITTNPGDIVNWSFYHLARRFNNGIAPIKDGMIVEFGPPAGPLVTQIIAITDDLAWKQYTGNYIIPAGQTTTRFQFRALYTNAGNTAIGNLIDNIVFNSRSCSDDDGDSLKTYFDLDSDNDGIPDVVEAQTTSAFRIPSGTAGTPAFLDVNEDGLDDYFDAGVIGGGAPNGIGFTPQDTDSDGIPDFIDLNSDGDTETDIQERGDGNPTSITSTTDTDGDGILDIFEGSSVNDPINVLDEIWNGSYLRLIDSDLDVFSNPLLAIPLSRDYDYRDVINTYLMRHGKRIGGPTYNYEFGK